MRVCLILIGDKLIFTCEIVMVCLKEWGLVEVGKKLKITESGVDGARFC